jgi:hypothetical protein
MLILKIKKYIILIKIYFTPEQTLKTNYPIHSYTKQKSVAKKNENLSPPFSRFVLPLSIEYPIIRFIL